MRLFIDDLRDAPDDSWVVARTSEEAIYILRNIYNQRVGDPLERRTSDDELEEVSFDHDLGGDDTTRPVLLWMIEYNIWPDKIVVHSANRVGVDWLLGMADQYAPREVKLPQRWRG